MSEGFLKGPRTCQPKGPSKPLQNAFNTPSKTLQEGVEIDDASAKKSGQFRSTEVPPQAFAMRMRRNIRNPPIKTLWLNKGHVTHPFLETKFGTESPLEIGQFSPHFGAISLLNYTENMENKEKSTGENPPQIQWRQRPEIADFCPLSWSNVS